MKLDIEVTRFDAQDVIATSYHLCPNMLEPKEGFYHLQILNGTWSVYDVSGSGEDARLIKNNAATEAYQGVSKIFHYSDGWYLVKYEAGKNPDAPMNDTSGFDHPIQYQ